MCQQCVHEIRPDVGRTCRDNGAYLLNFNQCFKCKKRELIVNNNREENDEQQQDGTGEQIITYDRNYK
jgi:hypothetical protein